MRDKLDASIPSIDGLGDLSLEELKREKERLRPYYRNRLNLEYDDYIKISVFPSICVMIENIEQGIDRWQWIKTDGSPSINFERKKVNIIDQ